MAVDCHYHNAYVTFSIPGIINDSVFMGLAWPHPYISGCGYQLERGQRLSSGEDNRQAI